MKTSSSVVSFKQNINMWIDHKCTSPDIKAYFGRLGFIFIYVCVYGGFGFICLCVYIYIYIYIYYIYFIRPSYTHSQFCTTIAISFFCSVFSFVHLFVHFILAFAYVSHYIYRIWTGNHMYVT